jgi:hypothetical protein
MALSFFRSSTAATALKDARDSRAHAEEAESAGPPTLLARDSADYLGDDPHEIGRRVSPTEVELFVDVAPALALQRRLMQLNLVYIALHNVACHGGEALVQALSVATQRPIQQLVIRRQGVGLAMASIPFIEVPAGQSKSLRIFGTHSQADRVHREALSQVLLAHASLAVALVGELTHHMVGPAFSTLTLPPSAFSGRCSELLMVPLGGTPFWAQGAQGMLPNLTVRITPTVQQAAEAWAFISGAWSRLRHQPAKARLEPTGSGFAPTSAMNAPPELSLRTRPAADFANVMASVADLARLAGVEACCAFDVHTAQPWATPRNGQPALNPKAQANLTTMARQAKVLLDAARQAMAEHYGQTPHSTGLTHLSVQAPPHVLMVQALDQYSSLAVAVWLNTELGSANLVTARLQRLGSQAA